MSKDSPIPDPEISAVTMRNLTRADVNINQIPDGGVSYQQAIKGPNVKGLNNQVGQPQPDRAE